MHFMAKFHETIKKCRECGIRKYQHPLVDNAPVGNKIIMFVDFVAPFIPSELVNENAAAFPVKKILEPFVQSWQRNGHEFYYSYMCKCLPLLDGVQRKPFKFELQACFPHLQDEIRTLKPQAVFLMGNSTYLTFLSFLRIPFRKWKGFYFEPYVHNKTPYIPITHPSLIAKNNMRNYDQYLDGLNNVLNRCINNK